MPSRADAFEQQLSLINQGLKAQRAGVSINRRGQGLALLSTLPSKTPGKPPQQQRVPLSLKADPQGLARAHEKALQLAGEKAAGTFSWENWANAKQGSSVPIPAEDPKLTVAQGCEQLEADFWEGKIRTSAAVRTWQRIEAELKRIGTPDAVLTPDLLLAIVKTTEAGSRTRLESCKVLKRLGKLVGFRKDELSEFDKLRTPYTPGEREVPGDAELFDTIRRLRDHKRWGWATAALAVYGCRPSETFSIKPADNGTARCLTVKRKGEPPEWRTAMALPTELVDELQLQDVDRSLSYDSPSQYDSLEAKATQEKWGKWLGRQAEGLQLYDLRHAWAVRSIREAVPTGLAARCMGHDISVHTRTYHRWLTEADVAAFVANRR